MSSIGSAVRRGIAVAFVAGAGALAAAGPAQAEFGLVPGSFKTELVARDGQPADRAGAHPDLVVDFSLNRYVNPRGNEIVDGSVRDVQVDLPPGLVGSPKAVPQCSPSDFAGLVPLCAKSAQVGLVTLTGQFFAGPATFEVPVPVYNLAPQRGATAQLGFKIFQNPVLITISPRTDGDYGLRATIKDLPNGLLISRSVLTLWGVPADPANDAQRPPADPGPAGVAPTPFLTNTTACADQRATRIRVRSWEEPDRWDAANATMAATSGCGDLPFEPSMSAAPVTATPADAPTGLAVDLAFPQEAMSQPGAAVTAHLRRAKITLPEGMTINPASANGLTGCTDAQMGFGTTGPVRCPLASRIGDAWATTPLLEEGLGGGVYVGSQLSDDPQSGQLFRIFVQLENEDRGLRIKLPGQLRVDAQTGRIEATFDAAPQLPVTELRVVFRGGPRAPLASPTTCGRHEILGELTSWAGQTVYRPSSFTVTCPGLDGFAPSFSAGSLEPAGGAFSPFTVRIQRPDRQDHLKDLRVELPTGVLAKLDGVPLCGDAAADAGSCPGESRVGTATIGAGAGDSPFYLQGAVHLTGPYKGAPFGLAVVTRAVAGPFDLGTVVVRQALHVDPRDAHVTIVSDPFPQIVKGVPLRLRSIVVDMDRPGFMVNPTDCSEKQISATIGSASGATSQQTQRFQVAGCDRLDLKPNLRLQLTDATQTRDGDHPGLVADLAFDAGGANLERAAVALPLSLALDVNNAQALCTPEQAEAKDCPAGSVVGTATAVTPLLHEPLSGNVYFVEGRRTTETGAVRRTFPKLWVALRGAIALDVWADTDVDASQRLVTTFASIPDAPISSFRLNLAGGEHGILALNTNVCRGKQIATSAFEGHNGRQATQTNPLTTPCASTSAGKAKSKKGKKGKKGKQGGARRAA